MLGAPLFLTCHSADPTFSVLDLDVSSKNSIGNDYAADKELSNAEVGKEDVQIEVKDDSGDRMWDRWQWRWNVRYWWIQYYNWTRGQCDGDVEDDEAKLFSIPFQRSDDGKIILMVDQVFKDDNHFRYILLVYFVGIFCIGRV